MVYRKSYRQLKLFGDLVNQSGGVSLDRTIGNTRAQSLNLIERVLFIFARIVLKEIFIQFSVEVL